MKEMCRSGVPESTPKTGRGMQQVIRHNLLLSGMSGYTILSFGQLVSAVGTSMTRFALTIWAWELTGQATTLALVGVCSFAPTILLSPVAGVVVDRLNRKAVLIASDVATGLWTVIVLILILTDRLEIWHLYLGGAFAGATSAFQFPAYSASITTMVDKRHYARASAMQGSIRSTATIVGPILAAALLLLIGIRGILLIDILSFSVPVLALLFIHIPLPTGEAARRTSLWQDSLFGFRYILNRPSLLGLQLTFFFQNMPYAVCLVMFPAMVLARSGGDKLLLGSLEMLFGIGSITGGVLFSVLARPKRAVRWFLTSLASGGVLGRLLLGVVGGPAIWGIGAFFNMFFSPIIFALNQSIWQASVPASLQGRVFAARRVFALLGMPLAMVIAGPLADHVLEPMMVSERGVARLFAPVVGTGPGAGMAILFVLSGVFAVVISLIAHSIRPIRCAEELLANAQLDREPVHSDVTTFARGHA